MTSWEAVLVGRIRKRQLAATDDVWRSNSYTQVIKQLNVRIKRRWARPSWTGRVLRTSDTIDLSSPGDAVTAGQQRWTADGAEEMRAVPAGRRELTVAGETDATDVRLSECPVVWHLTGDMSSARRDPHGRCCCRLLYGTVSRFHCPTPPSRSD